jgi:hypothetical protein
MTSPLQALVFESPRRKAQKASLQVPPAPQPSLLSLLSPRTSSPSTPKRRRVGPSLPGSAGKIWSPKYVDLFYTLSKTPTKSPATDSEHATSASPEKPVDGQRRNAHKLSNYQILTPEDSLQTQPESPLSHRVVHPRDDLTQIQLESLPASTPRQRLPLQKVNSPLDQLRALSIEHTTCTSINNSPTRPELQLLPQPTIESSQTQPESQLYVMPIIQTPSSETEPESPYDPLPTLLESSQTQPESQLYIIAAKKEDSSQTQPESQPYIIALNREQSSQTQPECELYILPVKQQEGSQMQPESQRDALPIIQPNKSQLQPESLLGPLPTSRTPVAAKKHMRGFLEDEENPFQELPESVPFADDESQNPTVLASFEATLVPPASLGAEESPLQPENMLTPDRKAFRRRLRWVMRREMAKDSDTLSDSPPSIPSDFDEDVGLSDDGDIDLSATPVKNFLNS